jgi:hypothetical protein
MPSKTPDGDSRNSSMIILVGDHSEGLGDQGEKTHGIFLYRSTLHRERARESKFEAGIRDTGRRRAGAGSRQCRAALEPQQTSGTAGPSAGADSPERIDCQGRERERSTLRRFACDAGLGAEEGGMPRCSPRQFHRKSWARSALCRAHAAKEPCLHGCCDSFVSARNRSKHGSFQPHRHFAVTAAASATFRPADWHFRAYGPSVPDAFRAGHGACGWSAGKRRIFSTLGVPAAVGRSLTPVESRGRLCRPIGTTPASRNFFNGACSPFQA